MLPQYAGASTAAQAAEAWYGLARATHHHAYDLAPTAAELRRWYDLVRGTMARLIATGQQVDLAAERPATQSGRVA
jgi:hypothetical protein